MCLGNFGSEFLQRETIKLYAYVTSESSHSLSVVECAQEKARHMHSREARRAGREAVAEAKEKDAAKDSELAAVGAARDAANEGKAAAEAKVRPTPRARCR